jgi:phage-related minor tail protein
MLNMAREDELFQTLNEVARKLAEVDKNGAVHAEQMTQVAKHLQIMNGRIAKSEDRLSILETIRAEMRGGYKVIATIAAAIGAIVSWVIQHWPGK